MVPQFFEKVLVFLKTCFKVKVLKTFKFSSDNHMKICQSFKRRAISKIPGAVFANSNFAVKLAEISNRALSIYLMNQFFSSIYNLHCVRMECLGLHGFCNHIKENRRTKLLIHQFTANDYGIFQGNFFIIEKCSACLMSLICLKIWIISRKTF